MITNRRGCAAVRGRPEMIEVAKGGARARGMAVEAGSFWDRRSKTEPRAPRW
jgi:hypothetical protein